jgi:hypothetical protein
MIHIRRWVYRRGFRPKQGSIFFSPTCHVLYEYADEVFGTKMRIFFKKE